MRYQEKTFSLGDLFQVIVYSRNKRVLGIIGRQTYRLHEHACITPSALFYFIYYAWNFETPLSSLKTLQVAEKTIRETILKCSDVLHSIFK